MIPSSTRHWVETKIGDIAEVIMGQSPPGDTYNTLGRGLPFYQGKADFGEDSPTPSKWCPTPNRIAETGDILLSVRAPVGPTNIASERCGIGRGLSAIRVFPEIIEPFFLLYFLRKYEPQLASRGTGSTFASINREDIESIRVFLPSLFEQQRIVAILRHADNLQHQRQKANDLAQKLLPALFDEMFGDPVDPQNAKGNFLRLDSIANVSYGLADKLNSSTNADNGTRIITISNVTLEGKLNLSTKKYSTVEEPARKKAQLQKFDLLFNWRNGSQEHIGKTALWEENLSEEVLHVSFLLRIRPMLQKANPYYLWVLLNRLRATGYFSRSSREQINRKFNASELSALKILIPEIALQNIFAQQVFAIRALEQEQILGSQEFAALFQSILARAFTGELTEAWRSRHRVELHESLEKRDELFKSRGFQHATITKTLVEQQPIITDDVLLSQLSPAQQQVYALTQSHPASYFTLQTLWESQNNDSPLDRDVIERGLIMLESLGVILHVSVPVSPSGEAFYQSVYRRTTTSPLLVEEELRALKDRFPNIRP